MGWKPGLSSKYQSILATQEPLTNFHGKEAIENHFFLNGRLKKTKIFKNANSQKSFTKCQGLVLGLGRLID